MMNHFDQKVFSLESLEILGHPLKPLKLSIESFMKVFFNQEFLPEKLEEENLLSRSKEDQAENFSKTL